MKIGFYTDPHLELSRSAHTTQASSAKLRDELLSATLRAIQTLKEHGAEKIVCLGDLFDSFSNTEKSISRVRKVVNETDIILAGNHDIKNSVEAVGSLQLLAEERPQKFVINRLGEAEVHVVEFYSAPFILVPHVGSQELFERALEEAEKTVKKYLASSAYGLKTLLLHCNKGVEGLEITDTTLNLSEEWADRLLKTFSYIFIGHEHFPSISHDGRVIVLGNVMPTSFSDISDKQVLILETDTKKITRIPIWDKAKHHWAGLASKLPPIPPSLQCMDLMDDLPAGEGFKLVTRLFRENQTLLAVRLQSGAAGIKKNQAPADVSMIEQLPAFISNDLKTRNVALLPTWEKFLHAEQTHS